jgi:hypothetical protein
LPEITIAELVRNGTMSAEVAATLWAAAEEQVSFLTVAIPRFAGKSTTSYAVLDLRPPGVPVHHFGGEPGTLERLERERFGGYIVVGEFSQAPVPGYIWGAPVRRLFETVTSAGYSLQSALHAAGVQEGIQAVTQGNGVPDEHASVFKLVLYIERFGNDLPDFWRRISELYEVDRVENGMAVGRTLFRWEREGDRYVQVERPRQFGRDEALMARRAALLSQLAAGGQTSEKEVRAAVEAFRKVNGA